jgi:kelch-like protein 10
LYCIFGIVKGIIAYRGSVYAIGGFNGTLRLSTGERYNPTMNTWRPITDMFHPRSNFAIEVIITYISLMYYKNLF